MGGRGGTPPDEKLPSPSSIWVFGGRGGGEGGEQQESKLHALLLQKLAAKRANCMHSCFQKGVDHLSGPNLAPKRAHLRGSYQP